MSEMTYGQAVRWTLDRLMTEDERVFLLGEDIGVYGGAFGVTLGLLEKFGPERVRDTPIAEAGIVGAAIGAALVGMRPIAEMQFSDFIMNAMDMIVNQAAKIHFMFGGQMEVPIVVRGPAGGGTGAAAQHSQSLEAWFYHVPGLKVVMPATAEDARGLLVAAVRDPNPVIFFEHKLLYGLRSTVNETLEEIPLGRATVYQGGSDATLVTYSYMLHPALEAQRRLRDEDDIHLTVIDLRSLVPLDIDAVTQSVTTTGRLIVLHEAVERGGVGADIAAQVAAGIAFDYLDAPILRIAARNVPIPYSPNLERAVIPNVERIVADIRHWWKGHAV